MKSLFKSLLRRWPRLYQFLREHTRRRTNVELEAAGTRRIQASIARAVRHLPQVGFADIGANDGVGENPLHHFVLNDPRWTGVFVEPLPFIFARLEANYRGLTRVSCANVAIGASRDSRPLYFVSAAAEAELGSAMESWYFRLGSFDKNHLDRLRLGANVAKIARLDPYWVRQDVQCLPLQDVLDQHHVHRLDVLVIDTEGYDFEVLKQVDFTRHRPAAVVWEHIHLSADDRLAAQQLLKSFRYRITPIGRDTLAIRRGA